MHPSAGTVRRLREVVLEVLQESAAFDVIQILLGRARPSLPRIQLR
jgi:hypothetical protein